MNRRMVLRAGGVALALPALESCRPARAAAPPKRFVVLFSPNGTIAKNWTPQGSELDFKLSPILEPLSPHKRRLLVIQGVDQQGAGAEAHNHGMAGMLTGQPVNPGPFMTAQGRAFGWAAGPSIDQVIASKWGTDTSLKSLELGVHCGAATTAGRMCYAAANAPLAPEESPYAAFDLVFSGLKGSDELKRLRALRLSVLDGVREQFRQVRATVSAADAERLDAHAELVRDIEQRLSQPAVDGGAACAPPARGQPLDVRQNDNFPALVKLNLDIIAAALACGLTRVASLQLSRAFGHPRFTWMGITTTQHTLSHEPDTNAKAQDELTRINRWYAAQLAYLLDRLAAVTEPDGTSLADSTLCLWCNELGKGNTHSLKDAPYVLAGGARGALRMGRFLKYGNVPHNNLLISILNAMDVPVTRFGKAEWCTGPLAGV